MRTSTLTPQETGVGSIHVEALPVDEVVETELVYHQLCPADDFEDLEGKTVSR